MLERIYPPVACAIAMLVSIAGVARVEGGDDWPWFRGPTAMGVVEDDPRLPDRWSKTENVRWVTDLPGTGWSSPIVSGGRVFLTTVVGDQEYEKPIPTMVPRPRR
jgi:hypothetical protein